MSVLEEAIEGLNNEKEILTRAISRQESVFHANAFQKMNMGWRLREVDEEIRTLLAVSSKNPLPEERIN